jgi:hypothetical protein
MPAHPLARESALTARAVALGKPGRDAPRGGDEPANIPMNESA